MNPENSSTSDSIQLQESSQLAKHSLDSQALLSVRVVTVTARRESGMGDGSHHTVGVLQQRYASGATSKKHFMQRPAIKKRLVMLS